MQTGAGISFQTHTDAGKGLLEYNVHEQLNPFLGMWFWSTTLYQEKGVIALFIAKKA